MDANEGGAPPGTLDTPVVTVKRIAMAGDSLTVHITKEARLLGLERGDAVRITIEKL